jgi:hypothetical protein
MNKILGPAVYLSWARTCLIEPRRHWCFVSHGKCFEINIPLVISEIDETRVWVKLHKGVPHQQGNHTVNVVVMTGGPLVIKDEATGNWVRQVQFRMAIGHNHTVILRKDPEWLFPASAALDFICHGTLVVEMIGIGDSRGVDIEIERGLVSVIRSSVTTFSGLISTTVFSAIVSALTLLILLSGVKPGSEVFSRLPDAMLAFTMTYLVTWVGVNYVRRPRELRRRLASNVDYLGLIHRNQSDSEGRSNKDE